MLTEVKITSYNWVSETNHHFPYEILDRKSDSLIQWKTGEQGVNTKSQGSRTSILDTRGHDKLLEDVISHKRKHLETAAVSQIQKAGGKKTLVTDKSLNF